MTSRFKVGDYVRLVNSDNLGLTWKPSHLNKIGIITKLNGSAGYEISLDEKALGRVIAFVDELELARIKDSKIARKLRAKEIDRIEKGWIYLKGVENENN